MAGEENLSDDNTSVGGFSSGSEGSTGGVAAKDYVMDENGNVKFAEDIALEKKAAEILECLKAPEKYKSDDFRSFIKLFMSSRNNDIEEIVNCKYSSEQINSYDFEDLKTKVSFQLFEAAVAETNAICYAGEEDPASLYLSDLKNIFDNIFKACHGEVKESIAAKAKAKGKGGVDSPDPEAVKPVLYGEDGTKGAPASIIPIHDGPLFRGSDTFPDRKTYSHPSTSTSHPAAPSVPRVSLRASGQARPTLTRGSAFRGLGVSGAGGAGRKFSSHSAATAPSTSVKPDSATSPVGEKHSSSIGVGGKN